MPKAEERLLAVVHALLHRCYKMPFSNNAEVPASLKKELSGELCSLQVLPSCACCAATGRVLLPAQYRGCYCCTLCTSRSAFKLYVSL